VLHVFLLLLVHANSVRNQLDADSAGHNDLKKAVKRAQKNAKAAQKEDAKLVANLEELKKKARTAANLAMFEKTSSQGKYDIAKKALDKSDKLSKQKQEAAAMLTKQHGTYEKAIADFEKVAAKWSENEKTLKQKTAKLDDMEKQVKEKEKALEKEMLELALLKKEKDTVTKELMELVDDAELLSAESQAKRAKKNKALYEAVGTWDKNKALTAEVAAAQKENDAAQKKANQAAVTLSKAEADETKAKATHEKAASDYDQAKAKLDSVQQLSKLLDSILDEVKKLDNAGDTLEEKVGDDDRTDDYWKRITENPYTKVVLNKYNDVADVVDLIYKGWPDSYKDIESEVSKIKEDTYTQMYFIADEVYNEKNDSKMTKVWQDVGVERTLLPTDKKKR